MPTKFPDLRYFVSVVAVSLLSVLLCFHLFPNLRTLTIREANLPHTVTIYYRMMLQLVSILKHKGATFILYVIIMRSNWRDDSFPWYSRILLSSTFPLAQTVLVDRKRGVSIITKVNSLAFLTPAIMALMQWGLRGENATRDRFVY